ncbi:hypothetical protein G9A89_006718 [Geosiphon pyriformis]|nr:hypothetical protein G9A89_006718 [Geosiphon pyriformis]
MSENTAHCSAMWSNVRKLGHITQQYEHCSRNYSTLLGNVNNLRTAPTIIIQTVAESEEIGTNYLGFAKSLFQYYHTHLELTNNSWPTELAFNCYVNERIVYHLRDQRNPEFTFNNFFSELLQSTTLPQNYLFALLITEINRKIEKYTKQRFLITFADKDKGRLQTPAGTPKQIQLPTWKKQRFDSPVNLSYYHTPRSTINIINTATTSATTPLNRIPFQSKQKKTELLRTYGDYFERFKLQSPMPSEIQLSPPQPDFGAVSSWEITDSEEKKSSDWKVNKQNLILEHSEIKTPVNQTLENQNNQNPDQSHPNLDPMAYAPIAKLKKFTGKKDDAQVWLNNVEKAIATNR